MIKLFNFKVKMSKAQAWQLSKLDHATQLSYIISFLGSKPYSHYDSNWKELHALNSITELRYSNRCNNRDELTRGIYRLKEKLRYQRMTNDRERQRLINSIPIAKLKQLMNEVA